jgi:hypothetical protein
MARLDLPRRRRAVVSEVALFRRQTYAGFKEKVRWPIDESSAHASPATWAFPA